MSFWKNEPFTNHMEYEYVLAPIVVPGDSGAVGVYTLSAKNNRAPLPVGCVLAGFLIDVQTTFVGAGASISIGNSSSATAYLASTTVGTLVAGYFVNNTTAVLVNAANLADLKLTVSGAAVTAGQLKVILRYVYPNS